MITSISVANFKQHEKVDTDFDPGLTLIVGDNYSGKSSLLQAILFALYGPSVVPGGAKQIQRRGAKRKPKVVLEMDLGARYAVTRSGSSASLTKDGEKIATGQSVVTAEIEKLLGMDAKTFSALRTSPQDEAGAVLTLGSAKLGQLVNQITGVDLIDNVIEKAKAQHNELAIRLSERQVDLDIEKTEELVGELGQQLAKDYANLKDLIDAREKQAELWAAAEEAYTNLRVKREGQLQADVTLDRVKFELDGLKEKLPDLESAASEKVQDPAPLEKMLSDMREAGNKRERLSGLLQRLQTEIAGCKGEIQRQESILKALRSKDVGAEVKEESLQTTEAINREDQQAVRDAHASLEQRKKELESGACQSCGRPFEGFDEQAARGAVAHAEAELKRMEEAMDRSTDLLGEMRQAYYLQKRHKADISQHEATLKQAQDKFEKLKADYKHHDAELAEIEPVNDISYTEAEDQYMEAKTSADRVAKAKFELETAQTRLTQLEEWLASVDTGERISGEQVEEAREASLAAQYKLRDIENSYAKENQLYGDVYRRYEYLKQELEKGREAAEKSKTMADRSSLLQRLIKYLRANRDRFLVDAWTAMLGYASDFARACTDGKITEIRRTEDGGFTYVEDGHEAPLVGASGVQRAIMGVGVRMALAESLRSPAAFMLLDEVTAGARDERAVAISRALSAAGIQIISVTHRQEEAAVADRVVSL